MSKKKKEVLNASFAKQELEQKQDDSLNNSSTASIKL